MAIPMRSMEKPFLRPEDRREEGSIPFSPSRITTPNNNPDDWYLPLPELRDPSRRLILRLSAESGRNNKSFSSAASSSAGFQYEQSLNEEDLEQPGKSSGLSPWKLFYMGFFFPPFWLYCALRFTLAKRYRDRVPASLCLGSLLVAGLLAIFIVLKLESS